MKKVAYIVESQKGYFKPFIATPVPDDDDCSLFVVAV